MYCSAPTTELFQRKPPFSHPSPFKPNSWTRTVQGYLNEARKLSTCIIKNRKLLGRPYSWFLTIYIRKEMSAKDAASLWTKACRNLRRHGIIALWVRETTKQSKVHYHLLIQNRISKGDLSKAIETAMPSRKVTGWHKKIMANDDRITLAYYITKAKIRGEVRGKMVPDKYSSKRLLFKAGLGLRKFGTIGSFWVEPKKAIWKKVQDREKRIAEGLADPQVRRLAKHVFEFLGGFVPLKQVERSCGYWADEPEIRNWIAKLPTESSDSSAP